MNSIIRVGNNIGKAPQGFKTSFWITKSSLSHPHRSVVTSVSNVVSYANTVSNDPLKYQTIPEALADAVNSHGDHPFIISYEQGVSKTFRELDQDSNRLANSLIHLGIKKGDRVGILSPNCYEWVIVQFAASKMGAIMTNVNPGYREKELKYCIDLVQMKAIISCQSFRSSDYRSMLQTVLPTTPFLKHVIFLEDNIFNKTSNHGNDGLKKFLPSSVQSCVELNEFMSGSDAQKVNLGNEVLSFDDPINIQFTSGTTGSPKGATLTHHNIVNNAYFAGKRFLHGLKGPRIICVPNPLYHCFGSVNGNMSAITIPSTVVLPSPVHNPSQTLKAIHQYNCNLIYGTPTMYVDLVAQYEKEGSTASLTSMERAIMSGAPCPVELVKKLNKSLFPNLTNVGIPYGSTETSPVMTMPDALNPVGDPYSTVGTPLEHVEVKICNPETGIPVPLGDKGDVRTRGYLTFHGYWAQDDKTKEVLDRARWYSTGDIGVMDSDGVISIVGRNKDMIIRGGENIYPKEIENLLIQQEGVEDANVVGVTDERMGEEICAFIIKKPGVSEANESIERRIRESLKKEVAHFKIPKHFFYVDSFPRTITLKIQKNKLKDLAHQLVNKQGTV